MNLNTEYLGFKLASPLVVSACSLSQDLDNVKMMEDNGASAVVLYSLFEEQIRAEAVDLIQTTEMTKESFAEALSYFPEPFEYRAGPEEYLEHIQRVKSSVSIPVIASLNGATAGNWTAYAAKMQQAGADAIELNIYSIPTSTEVSSEQTEDKYLDILKSVKGVVSVPVALKLSPYFTNMAYAAKRFDDAGADALVLFNRFYQPDIDLDKLEVEPKVSLSTNASMRTPMRWIAILKGKINANLAATSGIHSGEDAIKQLMVGADATMLCSTLYKNGIKHIKNIENEIKQWMLEREYDSVEQMKGSMSQAKVIDPTAFERAQYMKALTRFKMPIL
ncbi:MAG: dihydroorotate dehydrogenase-like protein [Chloroflexota bacterium]